jgi:hypothetical protein
MNGAVVEDGLNHILVVFGVNGRTFMNISIEGRL